jgi:tetratricopeptide (TPR) repeat protein
MVIDPISSAAISAGGKAAAGAAVGLGKKLTLEWRIAKSTASAAKDQGVKVLRKPLRLALMKAEVMAACKTSGPASARARELLDGIACVGLEGPSSVFLLPLLRTATARQLSVSDSQVLMYEQVIVPMAEMAEQGKETVASVRACFPAPLAQDAQALDAVVGERMTVRLLQALAAPAGRAEILRDWLRVRPSWLDESEVVDGWLGLLGLISGNGGLGREWIERALANGAAPRAYWLVLIANVDRSQEEALELLEEVRGHALVEAVLTANDVAERERQALLWVPQTAMQCALAASIRAQQLLEAKRLDEAVEFAVDAFESEGFTAAGAIGVQALIARSMIGERQTQTEDLSAARRLALEIRDSHRVTGTPSASSVVLAIEASLLLEDADRAQSLFMAAPEGEANPAEASDSSVRKAAALALLHIGQLSRAHALIGDAASPSIRLQLDARQAEIEADDAKANQLWSNAIDATEDWSEKAAICSLLALRGVIHPFVDTMRPLNPEFAGEIDTIAALFRDQPGAESRVASGALDNPRLARALGQYYSDRNRRDDGLRLAEQSARRWGDPDEWFRAARYRLDRGDHDEAVDRAQSAILAGGDAWGARARALRLQIQALFQAKRWEDLVPPARALLRIEPAAVDAAWTLVYAFHNAADDLQAFQEWKANPICRVPEDPGQASMWLHLFQRFGTEMAQVSDVLALSRRFSSHEQVRRLAVGAILIAPIEFSDAEVQLLDLAEEYHADFPDRPRLVWAITADSDDPKELLAAIDRAAGGPRPSNELETHMSNGTLPVGLIGHFAKRGTTEFLVKNRQSARFAGGSDERPADFSVVERAQRQGAALDSTAALTLATIGDDVAELLTRIPLRLLGTYGQLRDAKDAGIDFEKAGDLFIPSTMDHGPGVMLIPEEEGEERRRLTARMITRIRLIERSDPPELASPTEGFADIFGPWSEAIHRAAEANVPLWCDDAATRQVASAFGVDSFGTPTLVEYLRTSGRLAEAQADVIDATLIRVNVVGIRYRPKPWDLAATVSHAPAGLGHAILHGGPTAAVDKIKIIVDGMERCAHAPDIMQEWASVGARYVAGIAGSEQDAVDNLAHFIQAALTMSWTASHILQFILKGVRETAADRWYPAFRQATAAHWSNLKSVITPDLAADMLIGKVQLLPDADRQLVLEVIFRDSD